MASWAGRSLPATPGTNVTTMPSAPLTIATSRRKPLEPGLGLVRARRPGAARDRHHEHQRGCSRRRGAARCPRRVAVLDRREVDAPARRLDALDAHADRVAEAQRLARALAGEDRALLVELPPVAAQAAQRQQALVAAAEAHERAGADEARDLAVELLVPAALEQLALEHERARDAVGEALDLHRLALARRRPRADLLHVRAARRLARRRPTALSSARCTTRSG